MVALPDSISVTTITGTFYAVDADGVDAGQDPDVSALSGLSVTFTPKASIVNSASSTPPLTLFLDPVIATTNANGVLCVPDSVSSPGVEIVSSDDPDTSPTNWTWNVKVVRTGFPAISIDFVATSGATLDLSQIIPASVTPGTITTQGPKGDKGDAGPTGPTGAAGGMQSIVAGDNIVVDATDPDNPIITASVEASAVTSVNTETGDVVINAASLGVVQTSTTVNGHALSGNVTVTASDISAVPTSRTVNGNALSSDVTITTASLGAVPATRTVNTHALSGDVTLTASDVSAVPTTRTVNSKALSSDVTLAASDVGAVPTTRTVNSKALSADITLSASDVSAVPTTRTVAGHALSADVAISSSDVGLGNVDNTADTAKPVSTAQAAADAAVLAAAVQTVVAGTSITVDATDPNSPIISATSAASGIESVVAGDNVTVDITDPLNPVISADVAASAVTSVNTETGDVVITASDLGAYELPGGGIPSTDMTSAVQNSLGLADSALQAAPVTSVNSATGAVVLAASDVGAVPTTRTVNSKALSSNVTLAASDVGAVPTTTTVNSKALSSSIILNASDVSAVPTTRTVNGKALSANIILAESDITGLTTDLAAKAALASPTFTGTPAAPTATSGTNTTQIATTAFVTAAVAAGGGGGGGGSVVDDIAGTRTVVSPNGSSIQPWHQALAGRHFETARVACLGTSNTAGATLTSFGDGYTQRLQDNLRQEWNCPTKGGLGWVPSWRGSDIPNDLVTSTVASESTEGGYGYAQLGASGQHITWAFTGGTSVKVRYRQKGTGTFSWKIDSGAATNISVTSQSGTAGYLGSLTVTLPNDGSAHTFTLTWVSGTVQINGLLHFDGDETSGVQVDNYGQGSASSGDFTSDNDAYALSLHVPNLGYQLIALEFQGNDISAGVSIADYKANLQNIMDTYDAAYTAESRPLPSYLLMSITPTGDMPDAPSMVLWNGYQTAREELVAANPARVISQYFSGWLPVDWTDSPTVTGSIDPITGIATNSALRTKTFGSGHWNRYGHAIVADLMARWLGSLPGKLG